MAELSKELLHILQHSLGVDQYGEGNQYRNHFCAGGKDLELCRELAASGYMQERKGGALTGHDPLFIVTPAGVDAVALQSPSRPKLSRSKKRYQNYLRSECNEPFIWWLKHQAAYYE